MAQEQEYDCENLTKEYEELRLRTEGIRLLDHEPTDEELEAMDIWYEDLERLQQVQVLIDTHCKMYVNPEDKIEIARDPGLMGSSYQSPEGPDE